MLRLRDSRKGISASAVVALVLVIVSFFFVSGLLSRGIAHAATAEIACRASVVTRNEFGIKVGVGGVGVEQHPTPLWCQEQAVAVKDVKGDRGVAMKELANFITKCWWQFGKGQYSKTFSVGGVLDNELYCFPCYDITINGLGEGNTFSGSNLEEWMANNYYSVPAEFVKEEDGKSAEPVSYLDYVGIDDYGADNGWFHVDDNLEFRDGVSYTIVFVEPHCTNLLKDLPVGCGERQKMGLMGIAIDKTSIVRSADKKSYCTKIESGIHE